jgi:predicted MFS family arabinose efflux permease
MAALATSYWLLLAARLLTALAQALFWAVMGPVEPAAYGTRPDVRRFRIVR